MIIAGDVSTLCEIQNPFSSCGNSKPDYFCIYEWKYFAESHTERYTPKHMQHQNKGDNTESGSQDYIVETLAGSGSPGREDGLPEECNFNAPRGIAVHEPSHSCYVADLNKYVIRKVSFVNSD